MSANLTSGTPKVPYGLRLDRVELQETLLDLPPDHRVKVIGMLTSIWENGRIDFGERGHDKEIEGTEQLDPDTSKLLKEHLDNGGSIDAFFEAAGDMLGDQSRYDLSAFREVE